MKINRYNIIIAATVSLGGFLFGFDAAVISGVTSYIVPEFGLNDLQLGWAVGSLTLAASIAMTFSGPLSDRIGRKRVLLFVGLFYTISALFSALATNFDSFIVARMIGGLAVGAALILAPMYIAEISPAKNRGKLVAIQQFNIVLGFSAAYFSNYYLLGLSQSPTDWITSLQIDTEVWRWMLGIEALPALLFFVAMFFVPESPRWLMMHHKEEQAEKVLKKLHQAEEGDKEYHEIKLSLDSTVERAKIKDLLKDSLKFVLFIGIVIGVLQQITGVNAIYFYATTIFEQSGVGKDAAFAQAVWIGIINVVFTLIAMFLIDRLGRKPLLLIGVVGVAFSMFLTAYGFHQATYQLSQEGLQTINNTQVVDALQGMVRHTYQSDIEFKNLAKKLLGRQVYQQHESALIKEAIQMNPYIILVGILGFVASFALSLGPVMWVLLSELFPNWIRGLAISFIGLLNSAVSFLVQLIFPWELSNLGNAVTYSIFGAFAVIGFILLYRYLPETKGKSLEEIEEELVV